MKDLKFLIEKLIKEILLEIGPSTQGIMLPWMKDEFETIANNSDKVQQSLEHN